MSSYQLNATGCFSLIKVNIRYLMSEYISQGLVPSLNEQCLEKWSVHGERSGLTLGPFCLPRYVGKRGSYAF